MLNSQQTTHLADLQARLDGRLDGSGNPLKGYRKNVEALRGAITALNLEMSPTETATNPADSAAI